MKRVIVPLKERSYPIWIGKDLLRQAGILFKKNHVEGKYALVVTQKNIADLYGTSLQAALAGEGYESSFFITPPAKSSEASKTQNVFSKLIRAIADASGNHRALFLVALGGGVIGDLTGFAAAVFRRGIPYVQIPTTLTAQVDSAIGGKTGIDLEEGKNLLGAVYQPRLVLSDLSLLTSLPDRHWSDGLAEVIKYGVIKDPGLFQLLETRSLKEIREEKRLLERIIAASTKIKARIVEKDEYDTREVRIVLNFGHTAGHAIEAASSYSRQYTHGEAIAIGMLAACDIATALGVLKDPTLTSRLEKTLLRYNLPPQFHGLKIASIMKAMGFDKKSVGGRNRFVLPVCLGKTVVVRDVPEELILNALEKRRA